MEKSSEEKPDVQAAAKMLESGRKALAGELCSLHYKAF